MAVATRPPRVDYKAAMRAAIDARSQSPGERGVKPAGGAGTEQHSKGAGIGNEQNKLAPSEAGTGSRSGAKGGPSEHPQNLVGATAAGTGTSSGAKGGPAGRAQGMAIRTSPLAPPVGGSQAEEAGEAVNYESQEDRGGAEHGEVDNTVAGPRAVGRPGEPIPHAGKGNNARGVGFRAAPGGPVEHPQNASGTGSDGEGADGRGGAGGGAQKGGGHAQNRVMLVKSKHNADPGGEQPKKDLSGAIKRPGALTRAVGGKPSENTGKVKKLASKGTPLQKKQAGYFLNVLAGK